MPISHERAARSAARHNKRQAERNPLFAAMGALEEVATLKTAQDVQRSIDAHEYKQALHTALFWLHAFAYHWQAVDALGADACRDRWAYFCRVFPQEWQACPYHVADYWHNLLRRHRGDHPAQQPDYPNLRFADRR